MFWDRFYNLCKKVDKSPNAVVKELGMSTATATNWKTSGRTPNGDTLRLVADYFNVSADYLLGRTDEPTNSAADYERYGLRPVEKKRFRMIGEIACGNPIYCDEDFETYIEASTDIKADFCLTAKGDSMINARIHDGDVVFIRAVSEVCNGEIAAVIINDEATLKRVYYYKDDNKLILSAENPKYAPLVYVNEELNSIRIIGKAVAFMSSL